MTREELAVKSGISRSMISMMESGRRSHPTLVTVHALAKALGTSVAEIVVLPEGPKKGKKAKREG